MGYSMDTQQWVLFSAGKRKGGQDGGRCMATQTQGGDLCWVRLVWELHAVWAKRQETLLHSRSDRVASAASVTGL